MDGAGLDGAGDLVAFAAYWCIVRSANHSSADGNLERLVGCSVDVDIDGHVDSVVDGLVDDPVDDTVDGPVDGSADDHVD